MRDGERGHDSRDVPERGAEALRGTPLAVATPEDRRQKQREQEQDVIEAEPDVPDALVHVGGELLPGGPVAERLRPRGCGKDNAVIASAFDVLKQSAMRRVDVEEQPIVDREQTLRLWTLGVERKHRVASVAMLVEEQVAGVERARRAGRDDIQ